MNIGPEKTGPDIPEADALEQRTPLLPEDSDDRPVTGRLPDGVPQADFIDQGRAVRPGSAGYAGIPAAEAEADEADLIEGAIALPADDEEDYPDARQDAD